jgi:hypothetical protein
MSSLTAKAFELIFLSLNYSLRATLSKITGEEKPSYDRTSNLYQVYTSSKYFEQATLVESVFPKFDTQLLGTGIAPDPYDGDVLFNLKSGVYDARFISNLLIKIDPSSAEPLGKEFGQMSAPDLTKHTDIKRLLDSITDRQRMKMKEMIAERDLTFANPYTFNTHLREAMMKEGVYLYYFLIFLREYVDESKLVEEVAKNSDKDLSSEDLFAARLGLLEDIIEQEDELGRDLAKEEVEELIRSRTSEIDATRQSIVDSRFIAQRYLIQNMDELSAYSQLRYFKSTSASSPPKRLSTPIVGITQNRIVRLRNSHLNTISSLTGASSGKKIFNMKTGALSKLQPKIRIFKTKYDENMEKAGEVEIKFPTHNDLGMFNYDPGFAKRKPNESLEFPVTKRGFGIKSFSWSYTGADPFSVDKDIEAVLELYFQDFSQFTALRGKSDGQPYRYIDLVVPLESEQSGAKENLGDKFNSDIRIQAGWQRPESMSDAEASAITAGNIDLHLTMQDYSLTFDGNANGAASITINYRARAETAAKNKLINILAPTKTEMTNILSTKTAIAALGSEEGKSAERERLIKKKAQTEAAARNRAVKRLVEMLLENRSVYWRDISTRGVLISVLGQSEAENAIEILKLDLPRGLARDGLRETLSAHNAALSNPNPADIALIKNITDRETLDESTTRPHRILYTFFGDIVQAAMSYALRSNGSAEFMGTPKDILEDMKLICSEFKVGGKSYNIADLPIDMALFTQFLYDTIGSTQISSKPIAMFIKDLLTQVVINNADKYISLKDGNTRTFRLGYHSLKNPLLPTSEKEYDLENKDDTRLFVQGANYEYLVLYSDSPTPGEFLITNTGPNSYSKKRRENEQSGIFHFVLGTTTSLVKNISFEKVDLEYAREQRLTIEENDPYALLKNVFNVNIQMFGNNLFRPGSYLYIDPRVLGSMGNPWDRNSISNVMGLGGYHFVTKVSNTIANNSFETSIDAVWNSSGDGEVVFGGSQTKPKRQEKKK